MKVPNADVPLARKKDSWFFKYGHGICRHVDAWISHCPQNNKNADDLLEHFRQSIRRT
jgi:hypothetical protein